jgi:hypothetical protein
MPASPARGGEPIYDGGRSGGGGGYVLELGERVFCAVFNPTAFSLLLSFDYGDDHGLTCPSLSEMIVQFSTRQ